jgi:hypothetical protein
MDSNDLRAMMALKGIRASDVARDLGVTRAMVSAVIARVSATPWIRRALAEQLGIPFLVLWGEPDPGTRYLRPGRDPKPKPFDTANRRRRKGDRK